MPRAMIFVIRSSFFREAIGQVHLPGPMCGAFLGAYLTVAIRWSVGVGVSLMSQSEVSGRMSLEM